jgi:hypothetical protein
MQEQGFDRSSLQSVHRAYDVAKKLFGTCFRPSDKPFICHLVGTAGALADWNQSLELINAGLLHSAYLFGDFADGERGASDRRRHWLKKRIGAEAEGLIHRYTISAWAKSSNADLHQQAKDNSEFREILTLKIADVYDEIIDCGILFTPKKRCPFGLLSDESEERALLVAIEDLISEKASNQFRVSLQELRNTTEVPADLLSARASFYHIRPGIDELRRGRLNRRLVKLRSKFGSKAKAA